ncbi:MAG: methyltransferase domain-containing protein [Deltaproteobacteria bacterium]|nr:MAG: methyltransferase domain-containing protein [Deltaproteobacteria bacterium]
MRRYDEHALEELISYAAEWTGFSRDAILPDAVRRAAAGLGPPDEVLPRAAAGELAVVHALCQAVSVGETYFFRHPDHFRWVAKSFLPELLQGGRSSIRAWSAGCATGEEAYSIAACLLDLLPWPRTVSLEVVGTDLLERNLAAARVGEYGAWSQRPSGPVLHPIFKDAGSGRVRIDDAVRAVTRFGEHNLLEEPPGQFDLIFCRNVLVYFSQQAVQTAVRHLSRALLPGGALLFGSMDVSEPPPGLLRASPSELQIYRRLDARPAAKPAAPAAAPPAGPPPPYLPRVRPPEPVALHLRALVHIERGEKKRAEKELAELARQVPDYVPGILERALLHVRMGEKSAASKLMREVLRRIEQLPADEVLAGPEPAPVSFYRDSAQTFLRSSRGGYE